MSANDLSEAFDGLRTAMLADATFVAMLSAADAVYITLPTFKVSSPLVEFMWGAWNPTAGLSGIGIYRPTLTMNIFAKDQHTCFAIAGYLEATWSIPLKKPAGVTTTNFCITELSFRNPSYVGPRKLLNTNENVEQVAIECGLRINKR